MMAENTDTQKLQQSLEEIKLLLKQLLVVQLYNSGMSQILIAQNLNMSKSTVNKMLKGVTKKGKNKITSNEQA